MAMPEAWQRGYDWANGNGPHANLDIDDAIEACGYDLFDKDGELFTTGASQAQREDSACNYTGEEWSE